MDQDNDVRNRFTAWMQLVVKRARIDYIRSLQRHKNEIALNEEFFEDKLIYEPKDEGLESVDGFAFANEKLMAALYSLPKKRREILELLFIHNLTSEEIAEKLNCTVQNIYNQRSLALKELKEKMKKGEI